MPGATTSGNASFFRQAWVVIADSMGHLNADDGWAMASHVALSGLMALFPFLIFVAALAGFIAGPFHGAYAASKFAVEGWSDALRLELAGSGIFVSLIEPGPIATRFREHAREHFLTTTDRAVSAFREDYERQANRLTEDYPGSVFELGPGAVTSALLRALTSRRPRARYRVTLPAHAGALGKRLLPTRLLDWFVRMQR